MIGGAARRLQAVSAQILTPRRCVRLPYDPGMDVAVLHGSQPRRSR